MKERFLVGLICGLALLSVMVDFVSTILSVASDALLLGVAAYAGWLLLKAQRSRHDSLMRNIAALTADNRQLRARDSASPKRSA